jgi:antitoxin (DNA-binding transcriptional repressor) of toxin-antitoxin stability system
MNIQTVSSDQARTGWRDLLDGVIAGDVVIIERYGKPVAVMLAHADYVAMQTELEAAREMDATGRTLRERPLPADTYRTWDEMKRELLAELRAELGAPGTTPAAWQAGWATLRQQIDQSGGIMRGLSKAEIVTRLRETRQELFEAEYAHHKMSFRTESSE